MRCVLGIDAAWTQTNPSGVALVSEAPTGWRLIAVAGSYREFCGGTGEHRPDVAALLRACRGIAGRAPDLVAVDMPLALSPIVGRRASDLKISRAFGPAKAATHSPSDVRPGKIADDLRGDFATAGYPLCTAEGLRTPGVMEVYPHTALLALTGDKVRLTYKAGKTARYWPGVCLAERSARLREVWRRIVGALDKAISGVGDALPPPGSEVRGGALKCYEDRLDAVICAYVAIAALEGRARPYGDEDSAIWVPEVQEHSSS